MKKLSILLVMVLITLALSGCGLNVSTFENIEGNFKPLKEVFIKSDFSNPVEDFNYPKTDYSDNCNLYKNNKYSISVECEDGYGANIKIGEHSLEVFVEAYTGAAIVDLDTRDDFRELVLFGDGPSADPSANFYRYDGEKIYPLTYYNEEYDYTSEGIYCYFDGDNTDRMPVYGALWVDGKGKAVSSMQNFAIGEKRIAIEYYQLSGDNWQRIKIENPIKTPLEIEACADFGAFFTPTETKPESMYNFYLTNRDTTYTEYKKGQKIKILDYEPKYFLLLYVEVDGKTGVMDFWIGD